jgi:hypothetical protein
MGMTIRERENDKDGEFALIVPKQIAKEKRRNEKEPKQNKQKQRTENKQIKPKEKQD